MPTASKSPYFTVLIVPLDNRPINYCNVIKAGKSMGINVVMPPQAYVSTLLDNPKGHSYGNPKNVSKWVLDYINKHPVDGFIISADMLASGGLVGSRAIGPDQKISTDDAIKNLMLLDTIHKKCPNKPIFAFDTIMRLTLTVGINEQSLQQYAQLRNWAKLERMSFSDYDTIISNYNRGPKNEDYSLAVYKPKSTVDLDEYIKARQRKFYLNNVVLKKALSGVVDYLVVGIDDSNRKSIQTNEINYIQNKIKQLNKNDRVIVLDGCDEITLTLLSRMANKFYSNNKKPHYYVSYFSSKKGNYYSKYEVFTVDQDIESHIIASGGERTYSPDQADIDVLFAEGTTDDKFGAISHLKRNFGSNIPSIFIDAVSGVSDKYLTAQLLDKTEATRLLGYSSWNTIGNRIGIAIGMGGGRYDYISHHPPDSVATDYFASFLFDRLLEDTLIRSSENKKEINTKITELGSSPSNFIDEDLRLDKVQEIQSFGYENIVKNSIELYNDTFKERKVIREITGRKRLEFSTIYKCNHGQQPSNPFPWSRTSDVDIDFSLSAQ